MQVYRSCNSQESVEANSFLQKLPCHAGQLHFPLIDSSLKKGEGEKVLGQ